MFSGRGRKLLVLSRSNNTPENKSDSLVPELNLREKLLPRVAKSAAFFPQNWATFEALPQAKSHVCKLGEAVFHSGRIINICSKGQSFEWKSYLNRISWLQAGSARAHVRRHRDQRLKHSTQGCTFLSEHISPSASRQVLIQRSEPCLSPGNPGTLTTTTTTKVKKQPKSSTSDTFQTFHVAFRSPLYSRND